MAFVKEIKSAGGSDHAVGVLYAGMLGLLISDLIPTPADAAYFAYTRKLRNQFMAGEITSKEYWRRQALSYYGFNALWWTIVIGATVSIKGGVKDKLPVLGGLIGAGAVLGIISSNIRKDEEQKDLLQAKELAKIKRSPKA